MIMIPLGLEYHPGGIIYVLVSVLEVFNQFAV